MKDFDKVIKSKDKEIYTLNKKLDNHLDKISNSKAAIFNSKIHESTLRSQVIQLEKQLKVFDFKKKVVTTSCQTLTTLDTPYSVTEELPPIFASKLESCTIQCLIYLT